MSNKNGVNVITALQDSDERTRLRIAVAAFTSLTDEMKAEFIKQTQPILSRLIAAANPPVEDGPKLGENHPLAERFRRKRDPESVRRLEEGMKECREMVEALSK